MKKQLLTIFLASMTIIVNAQSKNEKVNTVGISIPVIWNNSEATYYALGNRKEPSGKGTSYGININHSRTLYKNLYGIVGIGYFKQSFNIKRPFSFASPTEPLFRTEFYYYNNLHWFIGLGYRKIINEKFILNSKINYNYFHSFRQKYIVNKEFKTWQVNKKSISLGQMINLNLGLEENINNKFSIGVDAIFPLFAKWNNDEIFFKYDYSNDTQQIARNKFSIGIAISCYYHF